MHDARHVRITEFDASRVFESIGHASSLDYVFVLNRNYRPSAQNLLSLSNPIRQIAVTRPDQMFHAIYSLENSATQ